MFLEQLNRLLQQKSLPAQQAIFQPVKLQEVSEKIYSQIEPGQIARYGNTGWILRCPKCKTLSIIEADTHKTYIAKDNTTYRLYPSLVCTHKECKWHVFAEIIPETLIVEE